MNRELFDRLIGVMSVEDLQDLIRLQHNIEQALDDIEFATEEVPKDVLQIAGMNDILVMQRYLLKNFLMYMVTKYNQ